MGRRVGLLSSLRACVYHVASLLLDFSRDGAFTVPLYSSSSLRSVASLLVTTLTPWLRSSQEYRAVVTVSKTEFALHLGGEKYSAPLQNPLSGDDLYDPIELGTENFSGSIAHLTFWRITISDRQAKHLDAPPPPFVYSSPVAVISAPSSVGSCASFTVDGSGSTSSGGANDLQVSPAAVPSSSVRLALL